MAGFKSVSDIKQATRQRLEYIEVMAFYTGVVSRSDVAKTFGLSDAAATKDLKLYGELAPDNLVYKHNVFGFVPSNNFVEIFADLEPAKILPMIAANLPRTGSSAEEAPIYGITVDNLPLPNRLPSKQVLAQIIRAIRNQKKLSVVYRSLSGRGSNEARVLEPHSLINTGTRWHFRAYNEETYDFRDFVLSRVLDASLIDEEAESSAQYDDDWMELVSLKLTPHPKLSEEQRVILMTDYSAEDNVIEIQVRRALIGYLLQRLSVDTTAEHSMNPNAYQLIVMNRDEVEPFAGWAFL